MGSWQRRGTLEHAVFCSGSGCHATQFPARLQLGKGHSVAIYCCTSMEGQAVLTVNLSTFLICPLLCRHKEVTLNDYSH